METTRHEPFASVLVALDLTEMDDPLIRYVATLSETLPLERIFFVHVAQTLELPTELREEYPGVLDPLDESITADMQQKVNRCLGASDLAIHCIVREGDPIEEILKLSKIKDIDLILMGRKKSLRGSGIVSSKIARKCPCSLLLVPSDFRPTIEKILVPVDFSAHAALAMRHALEISGASPAKLLTLHLYQVPIGYYKTGKSYEEFRQIMQSHAEKDYRAFVAKHQLPPDIAGEYVAADNGKHAELTYAFARENQADLIVIGSRGRTATAAVLMGSMAEKLVYRDSDIPVLIVKQKGENMGLLDTLMSI